MEYNAALSSVCFMLLLGFIDDVLDVPWRAKIALPAVAALPLLLAYAGGSDVLLPKPLRPLLGIEVREGGRIDRGVAGGGVAWRGSSIGAW